MAEEKEAVSAPIASTNQAQRLCQLLEVEADEETVKRLRRLVFTLPGVEAMLLYRRSCGQTNQEIAAFYGIEEARVEVRVQNGVFRLKTILMILGTPPPFVYEGETLVKCENCGG